MTLNGIGSGNNWYNPSPAASGSSGGVEKLEAEKKALQQELKRIKMQQKNSETDQKTAMMKKAELERKIADINQQIQKLRQEQQQGKNNFRTSQNNCQISALQNEQAAQAKQDNTKEECLNDTVKKLTGKQIDTYI